MFTLNEKVSFSTFIYSFVFDVDALEQRLQAVATRKWQTAKGKEYAVWQEERLDTEGMHPHIGDYINPKSGDLATLAVFRLSGDAKTGIWGNPNQYQWFLDKVPRRGEVPFEFTEAQLYLFRAGAGFVVLETRPAAGASVDRQVDFNHHVRVCRPGRTGTLRCRRKTGKDEWQDAWPTMVEQLVSGERDSVTLGSILSLLLENDREGWARPVYDADSMLGFSATYVTTAEGTRPAEKQRAAGQLIERCRGFYNSQYPVEERQPHQDDLGHARRLPAMEGSCFTFSLVGGAFVCIDNQSDFMLSTFPGILRKGYFPIFLLAHHQRVVLLNLTKVVAQEFVPPDKIMDEGGEGKEYRSRKFESLRDQIFEFTSRGYFNQVSSNERRQAYYTLLQKTLAIGALYREVSDRVREINETLNSLRSMRLLNQMEQSSIQQAAATKALEANFREQSAATEALKIVEIGIAGVYFLKAIHILLDYSGYHHDLVEHGPRFLALPIPFWVILTVVFLTLPLLWTFIERRKKKILGELDSFQKRLRG